MLDSVNGAIAGSDPYETVSDDVFRRSITSRVATSTVSFVVDQFARPIYVRLTDH